MKTLVLWLIPLICFLAGCGYQHAENVDPGEAGQALRTALEAWKEGKANAELQGLRPPIIMNESDWTSGHRLLDYQMHDSGAMDGRQVRWTVQIKLRDETGKVKERKATYVIDTIPRIVIVRDPFAS